MYPHSFSSHVPKQLIDINGRVAKVYEYIFDRERVSHGPTSLKIVVVVVVVVVVGTLVKFQICWNYSKYIRNIPNFEVFQIF